MNNRKKKKRFKKRFGFNPPHSISIKRATQIMQCKKSIIVAYEKLKATISDFLESIKKAVFELAETLKDIAIAFISHCEKQYRQRAVLANFQNKVLLRQRHQEREVMKFESDFNIHKHDRR